jgi:hypothetical protein
LGRSNVPRDIPQRVGYDRLRLQLGTADGEHSWTLERALAGGGFRLAEGQVGDDQPMPGEDSRSSRRGRNPENRSFGH